MNTKKIPGSLLFLDQLSHHYITPYLDQFSSYIQKLLHVQNVESERTYLEARCAQNSFFYVIVNKFNNQLIGAIEIRNPGHLSQLYCWINEQFWGNGYFQEAMHLAARAYKNETNHHTISACVDTRNGRSLHALEKAGFKKRGTRTGPHGLQFVLQLHINDIL